MTVEQDYADQRAAQVAIKAGFLAQFVQTWDLIDLARIDATAVEWVRAALSVIKPWRQRSADRAAQDYLKTRQLQLPPAKKLSLAPRVQDIKLDYAGMDTAAKLSLLDQGPAELRRIIGVGEQTEEEASASALRSAGAAASRHVLAGGRETTLELVQEDAAAVGWVRVTDGDPCAFCALLSSRGIAYKSEKSAAFAAHDGDQCVAAVVFDKSAPLPGRSAEFAKFYRDHVQGQYSGDDARRAFRRLYEEKQRDIAALVG